MSRKARLKGAHLYVANPYGQRVYYFYSRKACMAAYKELIGMEMLDQGGMDGITVCLDSDDDQIILLGWFKAEDKKKRLYPALAHECCHATFKILHYHGVKISYRNNEAFCYLMDDMMETIMRGER